MGGEWASGAALVSETWPAAHRGKALGLMQSAWAVGYAGAALVAGALLPRVGWRAVFFVGVLPALLTVWVRRHVREPDLWLNRAAAGAGAPVTFGELLHGPLLRVTVALTLMNACTMFGWWGLNLWVAGYLSLPAGQGGMGFSPERMALFVFVMQGGMWLGYVSYGFVADEIGRKRTYVAYLLAAAVLLPAYGLVREPWMLLALGPVVAFFGTGYFAGFGAVTAELYPTAIRGRAQGFTYNIGRVASAAAPAVVGSLAQARGFALAFTVAGSAFLLAALLWIWIPETRGRTLE
jgi:MFS family permease